MKERDGHIELKRFHKQWRAYALISHLFIALAISVLCVAIFRRFEQVSFLWTIPVCLVILGIMAWWTGLMKTSTRDIGRFLNQSFPELEESADLLVKPAESLNVLEKLQVIKIEDKLSNISASRLFSKRLRSSALVLLAGLVLAFGISTLTFSRNTVNANSANKTIIPTVPDKILPGISSVKLRITPPAYTRRSPKTQSQFSVSAEEGSSLNWQIRTTQRAKNIKLIFNDKEAIPLVSANELGTLWSLHKTVTKSGFYQVDLGGTLSDLYKLEVIKDQPASVRIIRPAQYSSIDFGEPQRTSLQVQIDDDYGINDAFIAAIISSGKGEGVKFREQKLSFQQNFSGAASYKLNKTIDLKGLGMVPGDELYFYVQARDSRLQESRSDIYKVTIQDTAQLMNMDGMLGGVNLVPEYFRSQRQIIIDTEKLLKERTSISTEAFNSRSNEIGVDQKLLRLRYGKFLGEEDESEIGGHQEETSDPADFGNPEAILDAVSHKHDQAEDATFFEPELKAQLKATLSEMWKSELQLRLYKPAEALPFEYKALRLLKDLQQKSRVYVAKTSFKPPVIKADKRLSGELDKIVQPQNNRIIDPKDNSQNSLKLTAGILAAKKPGRTLTASEIVTLNDASRLIASRAASQPASFLGSLGILRGIIRSGSAAKVPQRDVAELEAVLQKIIKQESRSPQAQSGTPANDLAKEYFNNLKRNR
ncbi:DUF4175 family protein [Daejeonella lutea]|uniref:DUF4175 family protein n=1 Tax=Daejeonella lutea TaxID=572036 RepID=A0A1T5ETM2_9SPHI|nr:DUF4175 family protein [Daejeonella lutea]SKB87256.1 protein of unknown function [Daejeonella lutea]